MEDKKISKLRRQDGVIVGNIERKDELTNPISRWLVGGFDRTVLQLLEIAGPQSVHEVGCGEGRLTELIASTWQVPARGTDLSRDIIRNNSSRNSSVDYACKSIYDLSPSEDFADLVLCCEVLEHVDNPARALKVLHSLGARNYIFSVPREPLWRVMNMCRGKYLNEFGNTPGHINHWRKFTFSSLLQTNGFQLLEVRFPIPWMFALCRKV